MKVRAIGASFMVPVTDEGRESVEEVPPSPGDQLLHDKILSLGLNQETKRLLNGEEVDVPPIRYSRHKWPLP